MNQSVTLAGAVRHCGPLGFWTMLTMGRWAMILLIMAVATLAIFLVMGGLLFAAGISERRQHPETPKGSASERKAA